MGLLGRSYLSVAVTEGGLDRQLVVGTRIRLDFRADSVLSASAGCNQFGGTISIGDGILSMDGGFVTQQNCGPERSAQDEWLWKFLQERPAWRLETDLLTLTRGSTALVLRDRKVAADLPLEGTEWTVESVVGEEDFHPFPNIGPAYLVITGTRVTGSTSCGPFETTVTRTGTMLRFGPITTPVCTGEAARLHRAVVDSLQGELTYLVASNRLELRSPDNQAGLNLTSHWP